MSRPASITTPDVEVGPNTVLCRLCVGHPDDEHPNPAPGRFFLWAEGPRVVVGEGSHTSVLSCIEPLLALYPEEHQVVFQWCDSNAMSFLPATLAAWKIKRDGKPKDE